MRWKLTIEYDGTDFVGFQRQDNGPSIQQSLEEAITKFSGQKVCVYGAGRTDAGVHAKGQVVHIDLAKQADAHRVREALNFHLKPLPIAVLGVEEVDADFHARLSAKQRFYCYRIINRRPPLTFEKHLAWHVIPELDVAAMQKAADLLIGQHDFSSFRASQCQAKSPIKTMSHLALTQDGDDIRLYAQAISFLHHQIRNIMGSLVLVGRGYWSVDDFKAARDACDRRQGGPTAPAQGLYFMKVEY